MRGTDPSPRRRLRALAALTGVGFLVIVAQLWYLQVLEGPRLAEVAERNRVRVRPLLAPRGVLYDRHGVPLVETRPAFTVSVIPREMDQPQSVLARLSILLRVPRGELEASLRDTPRDSPWPVRLRHGLTFEDVMRVEEWRLELPGVVVDAEPRRGYPSSRFAAHLLGYVREASRKQVREGRARPGALVGQSGLERLLDDVLRGRDGGKRIEVDHLGRPVRVIERREPEPGADVVTAIDRRLQEAAERALGGRRGAVVVMDPRNGDLLAMASGPAFDLARFTGPIPRDEWLALVRDPRHPLLNRAFQSQYPPGSIFKLVVAAAALQEALIAPADRLPCPAGLRIGDRMFRNWHDEDQGPIALERAIATSCNTYFYQLGLRVGIERIVRYARAFGFGAPTGIALGDEEAGLVPAPPVRGRWRAGETANVAIGQGPVLVTPLQVARFMAAIANGGILWRPRLVRAIENRDAGVRSVLPEATGDVELSPAVLAVLRDGLWRAVAGGGTGAAAQAPGVDVAGKTGTAQRLRDSAATRGEDHAWFAGYAPADDPEVVVVVVVEEGGMGGRVAAPLAGEIFREIFRLRAPAGEHPA